VKNTSPQIRILVTIFKALASTTYSFFFIEPNLEAIPETYIVLAYSISEGGWLGWGFLVSLVISIFSGGFGIAEFMKTGPCKMIPSTSGFIDGFVSLGFPAVVFSIIATFVGKGLSLTVVALDGGAGLIFSKAAMWMALNLLPQFIYVSTISNETTNIVHSR
jgi:hypothetical protein